MSTFGYAPRIFGATAANVWWYWSAVYTHEEYAVE